MTEFLRPAIKAELEERLNELGGPSATKGDLKVTSFSDEDADHYMTAHAQMCIDAALKPGFSQEERGAFIALSFACMDAIVKEITLRNLESGNPGTGARLIPNGLKLMEEYIEMSSSFAEKTH